MKRINIAVLVGIIFLLAATGTPSIAWADKDDKDKGDKYSVKKSFKAKLNGDERVPPISTTASGEFKAKLSQDGTELEFEFNYENLTGDLTDLHLQFGQNGVNGGVITHLCPDTGCPLGPSGMFMGHIDADHVDGPNAQGIAPGEFDEVLRAMREGLVYVNAHTTQYLAGEIRGQIKYNLNHNKD